MSPQRREIRSAYIEWAKLRSAARYKLAGSDMLAYPLKDLPVRIEQLEIANPSDSYGYPPLIERLAKKAGVPADCVVQAQGTSMANHLAMAALLEPDDEVLIEEPAYEALLAVAVISARKSAASRVASKTASSSIPAKWSAPSRHALASSS